MNIFSGQSPKATEIRAKINQWDLIKLTSFAQQKKPKRKYYKVDVRECFDYALFQEFDDVLSYI